MRIDLHTHAKWSKSSEFSYDYFRGMMIEAGKYVDAVALTEHFDTIRFWDIYDTLDRYYPYTEDHYVVEGVKVFPGMEVDVREKGHILLIGARESVAAIHSRLENHMEEERFIPMETLLDLSDEHRCIRIGAHPYRDRNPLGQVEPRLLARLDALDLNGRDLHHCGQGMVKRVEGLAACTGLPVVAGSDTHQLLQFGCVYNRFNRDCDTIAQLREQLRAGDYSYYISPQLQEKVQLAEAEQALYKSGKISMK